MKSPLLAALFHPLNIMMATMAVFAGLVSAWWLFPVGIVFWAVMVVIVSRDRALQLNARIQQREPIARRFQSYFDRIQRSQVVIFNTLAAAPASIQHALQPVHDEVDRLTQEAYDLCRRMTALENYRVVSERQSDLGSDARHLSELIEKTEDSSLRQEYEASRRAVQERMDQLRRVATDLDRVEAQLLAIANEMNGVVTEIVRLQAASPESAVANVPAVTRRLQQQIDQLHSFGQQAVQP